MNWKLIVAILCVYGFFKEFRPLEPFLLPYLIEFKNFTDVQLYSKIYPVWTYSYLAALVPIFLLTDLLRYNIILILGSLFYAATWILLVLGTSVGHMQLMQFFYGFATSTEIAYYAYSYAAIDSEHYKKTTSYVRCVVECGRFSSYALSQTLISTGACSYLDLNYIALSGSIFILIVALCLPCIPWEKSIARIREAAKENKKGEAKPLQEQEQEIDESKRQQNSQIIDAALVESKLKRTEKIESYGDYVRFYFDNLWSTFKNIYSTTFMWKWSLWCALATCGMLQVTNYVQALWGQVQTSQSDVWNGIVEAINTFLAAVVVVCLQFINVRWEIWGECTLAVISIIDCILLIVMSQTNSLIVNYILYIGFRVLYEMMFSIALYNIAKRLSTESFGLVFGFNTFVALVLQALLTVAVADERGFALDIRNQFVVYGAYHGLISIMFLAMGVWTLVYYFRRRISANLAQPQERIVH